MTVFVNGNEVTIEDDNGTTLKDYLEGAGCDISMIAVGKNGVVVPRASFASEVLRDGDKIEIVRVVGGG